MNSAEFVAALLAQIEPAMGPPSRVVRRPCGHIDEAVWRVGDVEVYVPSGAPYIRVTVRQWSPMHARWFGATHDMPAHANMRAALAHRVDSLRRELRRAMDERGT